MSIRYPGFRPSRRIFHAENIGTGIRFCSPSSQDAFVTGPRLLLFGQDGGTLPRGLARADVVILGYEVRQLPLPVAAN